MDEEAELSGDENERAYFMDDEDELDFNDDANEEFADLIDEDDSDIPSAGRLRRQIERVHHRLQTDQDLREIRYLKVYLRRLLFFFSNLSDCYSDNFYHYSVS